MSANELSNAASPYLLQHAENPVHWKMWTETALREAQAENKPILLSVGYAACHWCHVMAHESFEDEATAAVMNELFVNIKVDREERPDIDHIYMQALQAFGERGGWPLTMFLTPKGEPFWGGTYFPKNEQYGRPAFVTVLRTVAHAFHADPERIARNVGAVRRRLSKSEAAGSQGFELTLDNINQIAPHVLGAMDKADGGLNGAPKFPNTPILELLWRAGARLNEAPYREAVRLTLEHMSEGGVYDHLGGGFARYSTDERWLVPHFEKMLYDNAQILECLALCHHEFGDDLFSARAAETVGWVEREMTHAGGAFCASLDADSEGIEGKFYVWTWDEMVSLLGLEDARFFGRFYNASPIGNWADAHYPGGVTILNRLESVRPSAEEEARLAPLRQILFEARERRVHPGLDDKIMADWNGLMIAALVHAATLLHRPEWIALAARAYEFITSTMEYIDQEEKKRLAHSWRAGVLVTPGLALDHAAMIQAALALHEARNLRGASIQSRDYLADAIGWAEALDAYHVDAKTGLICMAAKDAGDVILRLSPTTDDAIPNAHPVFLSALVRLAGLTGDEKWLARADRLFEATAPALRANVVGHAGILNALDLRLRVKEIATVGPARATLYDIALSTPFSDRIVMDIERAEDLPAGHPAHAQAQMAGEAAAFVCAEGACSAPARDAETLLRLLRAYSDRIGSI
ncbi:thioredoxin domain-containing protein [Methylocella tundrae]|uniref:Thioredoxin domain-containing protein n=1 Tax=Methylocella tundrae TaxID=227605 RepID=A0A4U8Z3I3_METTU|nr:thioredoxin domain-containing protein [Methylocella tundrae]WPP03773.1 thioredoxin domain-containing protein [Methylocella tundrae]VFU09936.1 Thioredoxin domain-containing protein [Methylocella tundrae]